MGQVIRHEMHDGIELAVLSFMEILLGDDAPPQALSSFMEALFVANNDPQHPNVNEGTHTWSGEPVGFPSFKNTGKYCWLDENVDLGSFESCSVVCLVNGRKTYTCIVKS